MITVERISPEATYSLRHLVLWPHLAAPEDCTIDIDRRDDALHFGVRVGNEIVAIGSFFEMVSPKIEAHYPYRLRAMAVHPAFRGQDLGQQLIQSACKELQALGVDLLWCDARLRAVPFYSRLGFDALPEIYDVPRIGPHQFMWKTIV
jgi:GNAT superfamily N-acetyltransferase